MPLHSIPLCNIKYVGDTTLSGATFKYNTQPLIDIHQTRFVQEIRNVVEIDKFDTKRLYKHGKDIDKMGIKLIYDYTNHITKLSIKNFYIRDIVTDKEVGKSLVLHNDVILNKSLSYELSNIDHVNVIDKSNCLHLNTITNNKINRINNHLLENTHTLKNIDLCCSFDLELHKKNKDNLYLSHSYSLNNSLITQIDCNKVYHLQIDKDKDKDIMYESCKELDTVNHLKEMNVINNLYLDRMDQKYISKDDNIKNINRVVNQEIDTQKPLPLIRDYMRSLYYNSNVKNVFKYGKVITKNNPNLLENISYKNIDKLSTFLIEDNSHKLTSKFNSLSLNTSKINNIFNQIDKYYLGKDYKAINTTSTINVDNVVIKPINKNKLSFMDKDRKILFPPIDIEGLNKDRKQISLDDIYSLYKERLIFKSDYKPVHKEAIPIINHKLGFLEVTQRWWVLNNTSPYDKKILPYDYDYLKKPLYINRRDRHFGNHLEPIKSHPITEYISKASRGYDANYGVNEFSLSIEIMLDMTNIIGMIFNHSASQFVNCSGQESMEFITELLYDWLNLETTLIKMNNNGSREHYLRCYRWIRWEAEKIWFTADKDHTQDRMRGLSFAGKLFENLADYLKLHHFNIVPLWRNIKFMDIERQYNRIATNNDLMPSLDKFKCNRHYFIETNKK